MLGRWTKAAPFTEPDLGLLQRRDPTALRRMVNRHHGSMVGLARSILRNAAAADDVVQEAWIAVIAGLPSFEGRAKLSTWMMAILVNKARAHARREGRYVPLLDADDPYDEVEGPERFDHTGHWRVAPDDLETLTPERILAGREVWKQVRDQIDRLPAAQRAVLILRDVEGADAAETADILDLSAENQRVLLHRARIRLRRALDDLSHRG
ncbi:sigma-70 family RNA polymerase sigma factor [Falsirhodobacter sp. alg1]|uniref:sigma-70 family RNA polymerase sigma factor n=1 Tax=Falsirhodobacter sp. alg1 TaxID=1472418 RepID=UPI0005EDB509|nr:sigma-70 family RNA polymerase sigma factor [Falsirhodobacter sp. alg1]